MNDFVVTYDPGRKQIVRVPAAQAALLQQGGFPIGEDAYRAAEANGWGGAIKAFAKGVASGGTAGLSDLAMPESMAPGMKAAEAAHPLLSGAGKVLGAGGAMLATGGLAPEVAAGVRVLHGAIQGGTAELTRAHEHSEPVNVERVIQGLGLGTIFSIAAEGLPALAEPIAHAPAGATRKILGIAGKFKKVDPGTGQYKRALDIDVPGGIFGVGAATAMFGKTIPAGFAILKADRVLTHGLNNLGAVNATLDKVVTPVALKVAKTAMFLTQAGAHATIPAAVPHNKVDEEFAKRKMFVEHVANNPEAFADALNERLGPALRDHQLLHAGLITKSLNAFSALNGAIPKDPYPPTAARSTFQPTRKQKEDFLAHFHTVDDFAEAMKSPTHIKVQLAETTNPELLSLLRSTLIGHLTKDGVKGLTPRQKRCISVILGGPVSPDVSPEYLQRLHMTSQPPPPAPAQGSGGGMGAKAAQAVTLRDMPGNIQLNMGF